MNKAKGRCYEIYTVVSDIMYEAESGKITWLDALEQIKNELQEVEDNDDDS